MRREGIDAALIMSPVNLYYLAGTAQRGTLIVPSSGEPQLFIVRWFERARIETPFKCLKAKELSSILSYVKELKAKVVGVEEEVLPAKLYRRLNGPWRLTDVSEVILKMRMIKGPEELSLVERAARQCDEVLEEVPNVLAEGVSEVDAASQLERLLRLVGHDGYLNMRSWGDYMPNLVVLSPGSVKPSRLSSAGVGPGLSSACPVGSTPKKIKRGDVVWIDLSGRFKGYTADVTRTFVVGRAKPEVLEAFNAVSEIYRALVAESLKPGVKCSEVYGRAINMARELGFEEGFMGRGEGKVPFVGHGLGLELDEPPTLGDNDLELRDNMVVAVEPKIVLPGYEGVGLESTVVIQGGGCKVLDRSPLELIEVS